MKTQINTLVHGNSATTGTNRKLRQAIAERVIAENQDNMTVDIYGNTITLSAHWSASGKSVNYSGIITAENIIAEVCRYNNWPYAQQTINALHDGTTEVTLTIMGDMTAQLDIHHRRNERCTWKISKTLRVNESAIMIK